MKSSGTTGLIGATLAVLGVAVLALASLSFRAGDSEPALTVYCAVSVRPAVEPILARYEADEGVRTALQLGPSGGLETQIRLTGRGDLYVPAAVTPFLDRLREDGLVGEVLPIAEMRLVLAAAPAIEVPVASLAELLRSEEPFGLCNLQAAAGEQARRTLQATGQWDQVAEAATASLPTVTELAEAVRQGGRLRYGIVWDATARQFGLRAIDAPELVGAVSVVGVGVLEASKQPEAARRLARYLALPKEEGL